MNFEGSHSGERTAEWYAADPASPPVMRPGNIGATGAAAPAQLTMIEWRSAVAVAPASELSPLLGSRPERPVGCSAREWANVLLDAVIARQRWVAYESAQQVHDLVELSAAASEDPGGVEEFLATELALALGVAESTAGRYLLEAAELTARCPATLHALEQGRISPGKASVICRGTADLTGEVTALVEADVLPAAGSSTVPGLRNAVARSVIRRDPDGAQRRHEQARRRRSVSRRSDLDGMACLSLYGTAQDVAVIWDCLTAAADAGKTEGDDRSIGERRVDALVDVCTDVLDRGLLPTDQPLPATQRRRPHLLVTLPASALVNPESGRGEVAELIGHGPITPAQARVIAADATWRRLVCDPTTGELLDYGRTTYTPPKALTDFVLTRDQSCVMPGCRQPAHRCDVDHRQPFHPGHTTGGDTSADNLAVLCRRHHRAKDTGGYQLHRTEDGDHHWTTPLGRTYTRAHTRHWEPPETRTATAHLAATRDDDNPPPF